MRLKDLLLWGKLLWRMIYPIAWIILQPIHFLQWINCHVAHRTNWEYSHGITTYTKMFVGNFYVDLYVCSRCGRKYKLHIRESAHGMWPGARCM